jgi:hypothetical protein
MPFQVDPNQYTSIPARTPAAMLSLFRALVAAAAEIPTPPIVNRLTKMHVKASTLQKAWIDANRPNSGEGLRIYDIAVDRRWAAVRTRLQPWVDAEDEEYGPRAAELLALLFPTGLDFLNIAYAEQWAEGERRLMMIDQDQLETDLIELAGERFLQRLRQAQIAYGDALGITKKKDIDPDTARVLDSLRALRSEIAGYARLVLGLVDDDDDTSIAAAELQLEPILRYRKPRAEGEADKEEAEEPVEAPLPEPPASE